MFVGFFETPDSLERPVREPLEIEIISFGIGDGTGKSKGNLAKEGKKSTGKNPESNIEDAKKSAKTKKVKKKIVDDITQSSTITPTEKLPKNDNSITKNEKGNANKTIGNEKSNDRMGTGLGDLGNGAGSGHGFGDIDWGGGGNRQVLHKQLPSFPSGVHSSARIVLKFRVMPDGSVSRVIPMQKADPALEKAAVVALKRWRFNPRNDDVVMEGTIPLTFVLR